MYTIWYVISIYIYIVFIILSRTSVTPVMMDCPYSISVPFQRYLQGDTDEHRQLFDLIEKLLEYDPLHRITLKEAIKHPFFEKLPAEQKVCSGHPPLEDSSEKRARSHSLSR